MPPWHIDKTVGIQKFKNDRSLSDEQIDTILKWVAAGAPKGDPKDMPAPKMWTDESRLAARRQVRRAGSRREVAASTRCRPSRRTRGGGRRSPTGLTEPRWVRAIEIRPVGKNAARSRITRSPACSSRKTWTPALFTNDPNVAGDGLFMEWAVGKNGDEMRPDSGRLMLPNSKIVWEMHYHAVGEEISAHRARRLVLPEGPGAEASRSARALQHVLRRHPRARHPAEPGDDDRELRDAERERADRELPGAHAPARQGHVDGSDLSRTAAARC